MNLISCERCGAVLDKDRIIEDDIRNHDTGEVIETQAAWNQKEKEFMAVTECPACSTEIFYATGDTTGR